METATKLVDEAPGSYVVDTLQKLKYKLRIQQTFPEYTLEDVKTI